MFGHQVYALALPKDFMDYNIVHLEMLNIVVALKVWGQNWANKRVHIFCDNRAVVDTLNFGRARDDILATCARNIWLLTAMFNITLVTTHVYGTKNVIADLLSRWDKTADNVKKISTIYTKPHMGGHTIGSYIVKLQYLMYFIFQSLGPPQLCLPELPVPTFSQVTDQLHLLHIRDISKVFWGSWSWLSCRCPRLLHWMY